MKKITPGKLVLMILFSTVLSLVFAPPIYSYVYGEESPTTQLIIDKRIKATETSWQDNLTASEKVFKAGDLLDFEIKVKNSGDKDLKNITVKDILPSFLSLIFAPAKDEDKNNEIVWKIENLSAGKEQTFRLRAEVKKDFQAETEGNFCAQNKAEAAAESGEKDSDTTSFCLTSVKKLPKAGAENILIGTIISAVTIGFGFGLRKFGRGEIFA